MIFLKTTITRINGVPTSEERLLNIGSIVSSESLGGSSIIKYKYILGERVVINTMVLDLSYAILKKAIALYNPGHTIELSILSINGISTSQSLSLQADNIVDGVASDSDSIITYIERGSSISYKADQTLDQIIALANVDVVEVSEELNGAVTVTYDNVAGGPFTVGETVTNNVSGATGEVVSDDEVDTLVLKNVTGEFNDNDDFVGGTSGATADTDGATDYTELDLTGNDFAGVVEITSPNDKEIIDSIVNPPVHPFEIRSSGTTEIRIIDSATLKTLGPGGEIVLQGANGDWAKFENRDGVVYELAGGQYTA